MNAVQLYPQAQ